MEGASPPGPLLRNGPSKRKLFRLVRFPRRTGVGVSRRSGLEGSPVVIVIDGDPMGCSASFVLFAPLPHYQTYVAVVVLLQRGDLLEVDADGD